MTAASPRVSICIPTYNGARYLRSCLDSAIAQTLGDHEILIVDDGSTDETLTIAEGYADRDSRLRVVSNEARQGLPGNWTRCLELARGEWVKFLFQDDVLESECLERMLASAPESRSLVVSPRRFLFEPEVADERRTWYLSHLGVDENFPAGPVVSAEAFCRLALDEPGHNLLGEPTSMLLHRSVLERFGPFQTDLIMICDSEYWARIASHDGFVYLPEPLVRFRVHGDSASSSRLDGRAYRVALDGLVLLHEILHAPIYNNLRSVARSEGRLEDLAKSLRHRAQDARRWAEGHSTRDGSPDHSLLEEWQALVRLYPRMERIAGETSE